VLLLSYPERARTLGSTPRRTTWFLISTPFVPIQKKRIPDDLFKFQSQESTVGYVPKFFASISVSTRLVLIARKLGSTPRQRVAVIGLFFFFSKQAG
jgi:hypothetical protein